MCCEAKNKTKIQQQGECSTTYDHSTYDINEGNAPGLHVRRHVVVDRAGEAKVADAELTGGVH